MQYILIIIALFFAISAKASKLEIDADRLDIDDKAQLAIFSGNVRTSEDGTIINSDKMVAHYHENKSGKNTGEGLMGGSKQLETIDFLGNVTMKNPKGETASSKSGIYDVKGKIITMNHNVTLTQKTNTLKGEKLVYNMLTGKSQVTGGGKVIALPEDEPGKDSDGRVKIIFNNDEKKK